MNQYRPYVIDGKLIWRTRPELAVNAVIAVALTLATLVLLSPFIAAAVWLPIR